MNFIWKFFIKINKVFQKTVSIDTFLDTVTNPKKLANGCQMDPKHIDIAGFNYCPNCKKWMCDKCLKVHKLIAKEHKIAKSEHISNELCSLHPSKYLEYYCSSCKVPYKYIFVWP